MTPHQWFDRSTWPADFVGRYEPDYYEEAMTKRLQKQARPSLAGYFIHRNTPPSQPIRPKDVIGRYSVVEVENGWGSGEIKLARKHTAHVERDLPQRRPLEPTDAPQRR